MPWTVRQTHHVPQETARILATVPEWFGRPESNLEYIDAARRLPAWTVEEHGQTLGVALIEEHNPVSWEVHLMAVDREAHGCGIGTSLMQAMEADAREAGVRLLQVKTLGPSDPDRNYARTRRFYERCGFLPLEENDLWGEDTPCLLLVKAL